MRIGRAQGSQTKVNRLLREIEELDRKATEHKAGKPYLPKDAPGEVMATQPEADNYHPPIGWQRAVCDDVHDLGVIETKFGLKHQVEFLWELEARREDGRRWLVSRRFNPSLGDTSTLRKFLEVWQGYAFTRDELKAGVALAARYVGRDGLLLLEAHVNEETGRTYVRVLAGYPLPVKAARVRREGTYIRKAWRKKKGEARHEEPDVVRPEPPASDA